MKKPERRRPETIGAVRIREVETTNKQDPWKVQAEWRDPDDSKKRLYHKENNWRAAREFARTKDKELAEGKPAAAAWKFGKAWLDFRVNVNERATLGFIRLQTRDNDLQAEKCILAEFENRKLSEIEPSDIDDWIRKLQLAGLAPRTVRKRVGMLRKCFDFCVKRKKKYGALYNPARSEPIRIEGKLNKRRAPRVADMDAYEQFLRSPRGAKLVSSQGRRVSDVHCEFRRLSWANRYIIFALGAGAGLRPNETSALKWESINLSSEMMDDLAPMHLRVNDKTGGNTKYGIGPPKTDASARDVPICQWVYDALMDHMRIVGEPRGFIFRQSEGCGGGEKPFHVQHVFQMHRTAMRAAGLVKDDGKTIRFTPHMLRHFYPSIRIEMGHNITAIAEAMGHEDSSTTLQTYSHNFRHGELTQFWIDRFAPACVDTPRSLTGYATEIDDDVPMITGPTIDGTATEIEDVIKIPPGATIRIRSRADGAVPRNGGKVQALQPPPWWVHEAIRLINGGWRLSDILNHLHMPRNRLSAVFHKLGLPPPAECVRMVRDAKIETFINEGLLDSDIAPKVGVHRANVGIARRRLLRDADDNPLPTKDKSGRRQSPDATLSRSDQLKLL